MQSHDLRPPKGALHKQRKRVGRGDSAGQGSYSGKGMKGQKARTGVALNGFEGGQLPIYRRLPKRGFNPLNRKIYSPLNLARLEAAIEAGRLDVSQPIDEAALRAAGLVRKGKVSGVRLLGVGSITKAVKISVSGASAAAIAAIEQAGGSVTVPQTAEPAEG